MEGPYPLCSKASVRACRAEVEGLHILLQLEWEGRF